MITNFKPTYKTYRDMADTYLDMTDTYWRKLYDENACSANSKAALAVYDYLCDLTIDYDEMEELF